MDEFVYRFLLQSGYPRASIVADLSLLPLAGPPGTGDADGDAASAPAYAIVDPGTGDRLALVDVVGAVDGDALRAAATRLGAYARRFGGRVVQAFLVRVDPAADPPEARVQFYRAWPDETLRRTSAKAFPDLDSLRTWQLLAERRERSTPGPGRAGPGDATGPGALAWLPGVALALLAAADRVAAALTGIGLVDLPGAVLIVGAAALLTAPALRTRPRPSRKRPPREGASKGIYRR